MSDSQPPKYFVSSIVKIFVGVAIGSATTYLTTHRPQLRYEVISSPPFTGAKQKVATPVVAIYNPGNEEAEDVRLEITIDHGTIDDSSIAGLSADAFRAQMMGPKSIAVEVPYLNPDDKLTVQLYVTVDQEDILNPTVDLRSKGVTGTAAEPMSKESLLFLGQVVATVLLGALFLLVFPWWVRR